VSEKGGGGGYINNKEVRKMLNKEELKMSLKLYKDSLGPERYKVKPEKRVPVEVGQIRVLFWMPNEYVLVYHIEEGGLVHAVLHTQPKGKL